MWTPELAEGETPRYRALADAIARDVNRGVLKPGDRLPTHRALARRLRINVGTVTRGYAEAERRGLTRGEVGRGTFVRGPRGLDGFERPSLARETDGVVDLSLALPWIPPDGSDGLRLADTLRACAGDRLDPLLSYQPRSARPHQLEAGSAWLERMGAPHDPDRLVFTAGSQHGLLVTLSALLAPGDVLLTAELTYPGMKSLAQLLGFRLRGVAMDEEGIDPDALDRAFGESGAAAVYAVPTFQNPTCATMSEARRLAIADVAWSHGALVVEDDVYGPLAGNGLPTLASFAPERTVYITGFSKAVSFGLRVGMVVPPADAVERVRAALRATMWMAPPLMIEVATRWMEDGTVDAVIARARCELLARHALLRERLGRYRLRCGARSLHAWMELPEGWRSADFVRQAEACGVRVAGAEVFAVAPGAAGRAVRLCLGEVATRERLDGALRTLAAVARGRPGPCSGIL